MTAGEFVLPGSLWKAVAHLSGLPWPPRDAAAAERVVDAIERNQLLAVAAHDALAARVIGPPLAARWSLRAGRQRAGDRECDEILTLLLQAMPVEWLAVHGSDLRSRVYPQPWLRSMKDIDVLIRSSSLEDVAGALAERGLTRLAIGIGREHKFTLAERETWLDVYTGLLPDTRIDIGYEEVWRDSETAADGLPRMAEYHALATHVISLSTGQYCTHLRRFLDLWLLSRDAAVLGEALDCARRWNARRSAYASFRVMMSLFPGSILEDDRARLEGLVTPSERAALERHVIVGSPRSSRPGMLTGVRRKFLLLDSPRHVARVAMTRLRRMMPRD